MNKNILGIDLGTSCAKLVFRFGDGKILKSKSAYMSKTPQGWIEAIKNAFKDFRGLQVDSIALSSQVGTYIINGKDVISWEDGAGGDELREIKKKYPQSVFIKEIAMPHPDIVSYPIPRLMYIKKHCKNLESVCQPKDYICKILTGKTVSDKYSYRGLVNTKTGEYSKLFLDEIGISADILPKIISSNDIIGTTDDECEKRLGIPKGIPVYAGLNDFFASVLGMGIEREGDMFDITGTSEHIGVICGSLQAETKMVSGVYMDKFIHYGVTASSGASLDFAIREFGLDGTDIKESLKNRPPIFTPYLNGERAPIFDSRARGVFFGLNSAATKRDMAYSVMEGVVFSLYHIYESMGMPRTNVIKICGGASANKTLNTLKAEMFNTKVCTVKENDTSALGAICVALKKEGCNCDGLNPVDGVFEPCGEFEKILKERYSIYKEIYFSLKEQFERFSKTGKDLIV